VSEAHSHGGHSHGDDDESRFSVEEHLADILATIEPLMPTELGLSDANGLVLAEDITALSPLPPFDNSAMDGYAVRADDVAAASAEHPVTLPVVAEVAAGDTGAYALPPGTAIKIMTGAMLPRGAEAVIPVELTDGGASRVSIREKVDFGASVRLAGGDASAGDVLVRAGTRLGPMHIGVIAASGHGTVLVRPRPRVVVLSTGDELAEPGTPIIPGRIWDSNSFMLAAAAREAGCLASRQAIVRDNPEDVLPAIEDQLARADLLITSGGVSMGGEHDVVKAALEQLGTISFRKVAMQPGMPQGFGTVALPASATPAAPEPDGKSRGGLLSRLAERGEAQESPVIPAAHDRVPIFNLPGNPVSSYVSFQLFIRPAIGALQGYDGLGLETIKAEITAPVTSPAGRRSYLRAVLDRPAGQVAPLTGQQSHQVATLGRANALIIVPEQVVKMAAGDTADVVILP
jgi:molybdopterin molybdotransferase